MGTEAMTDRIILHLDMNAFFASVEQQANPELRGKPIAVIGSNGRTVVTTASYEARKFGVKTGMAIWEAKLKCPQVILVVGDNRKYTYTSTRIFNMMLDYTPLVEVFSIDEAFLDVTRSLKIFGTPERIVYLLKSRIKHSFGLTCSVGVGPNKLIAKLASDMKKPDGLTIIRPEEVSQVISPLPIKDLCGIGSRMEYNLNLLGIRTIGDLGRFPADILIKKFGVTGQHLHNMGMGIDESPVVPAGDQDRVKSVGHSMTLKHDISKRQDILKYLLLLSEMVGRRARRYGVSGKTVHLYVRYSDFYSSFGKQQTVAHPISLSDDIYKAAVDILDTVELQQPVRLLGIRLTNLRDQSSQLPLFPQERKKALMVRAMDAVNNRYGDFTVTFASLMDTGEKGSQVISPAWRPGGIRCVDIK